MAVTVSVSVSFAAPVPMPLRFTVCTLASSLIVTLLSAANVGALFKALTFTVNERVVVLLTA